MLMKGTIAAFISGATFTAGIVMLLGAYNGGVEDRYQIAGTESRIYVLDTYTGEIRFCGQSGNVIRYNFFDSSGTPYYHDSGIDTGSYCW